jgi:hypothetical protein
MFDFHAAILFAPSRSLHRAKVTTNSANNLPPVITLIRDDRDKGNTRCGNKFDRVFQNPIPYPLETNLLKVIARIESPGSANFFI